MAKRYEIIPGRSIGPFQLGQTRDQVQALGIQPSKEAKDGRGAFYPLVKMSEEKLAKAGGMSPGLYLSYDESGRLVSLQALFSYRREPPFFTLFGEVVNSMTFKRACSLISSVSSDTRTVYAAVRSAAAGIQAAKYEAGDEHIMSITVKPPEPG